MTTSQRTPSSAIGCNEAHTVPPKWIPGVPRLGQTSKREAQGECRAVRRPKRCAAICAQIRADTDHLQTRFEKGADQVTEHCNVLRSDIQLATESAIEQMQACSDELVRQVDLFEKSCRDEYSSDKHFEKTLKEVQYIYPLPIDH